MLLYIWCTFQEKYHVMLKTTIKHPCYFTTSPEGVKEMLSVDDSTKKNTFTNLSLVFIWEYNIYVYIQVIGYSLQYWCHYNSWWPLLIQDFLEDQTGSATCLITCTENQTLYDKYKVTYICNNEKTPQIKTIYYWWQSVWVMAPQIL